MFLVTLFLTWSATGDILSWDDWKIKFNQEYESNKQEKYRSSVYKTNVEKINEHNKLFERGLASFEMGLNQFSAMTFHERNEYLNQGARDDPQPLTKCGNWSYPDFPTNTER